MAQSMSRLAVCVLMLSKWGSGGQEVPGGASIKLIMSNNFFKRVSSQKWHPYAHQLELLGIGGF